MNPTRPPKLCPACHINHAAWTSPQVDLCYQCMPGGPFAAPPCSSCGSEDYFSQGLCERCHPGGPDYLDSCRDCLAWGVKRQYNWRCWVCRTWKSHYPQGQCPFCRREGVPIGDAGACRMCYQNAKALKEPGAPIDLLGASTSGQQLTFANMVNPKHRTHRNDIPAVIPPQHRPTLSQEFTPQRWRQEPLFYLWPSTTALRLKAAAAPHPGMQAHLDAVLDRHAQTHGWSVRQRNSVGHTFAILQAVQATPGSLIKASDVQALTGQHGVIVESTLEVLHAAGLLEDDRITTIRRYFTKHTNGLPQPMHTQLDFWFTTVSEGTSNPPRSKPRHPVTVRTHLHYLLPVLRGWAAAGHDSLTEVTRADVKAVLPASGNDRVYIGSALRSLFRILKVHKKVFINPTAQLPIGQTHKNIPMPLDTNALRTAFDSSDPAEALAIALIVFYALTANQVRHILLTDVSDGRLRLGERLIPLAQPVRVRLAAYLDYRNTSWPYTRNPHLFINRRSAPRLDCVSESWPLRQAGVQPRALREDRILAEIHATGGDLRRLCDLFGLSVAGASRYAHSTNQPTVPNG